MPMTDDDVADLKAGLAAAKSKTLNFAICMGSKPEGTIFLVHKSRSPEALARQAKADGETKKIIFGQVDVAGSVITLRCVEDVPTGIGKSAKKFLQGHKLSFKVAVLDATGARVEAEAEAEEAPARSSADTAPEPSPTPPPETTPSGSEGADWLKVVAIVAPQVQAFVDSGAEKAAQINAIWVAAQAAATKGKYADAKTAVAKIIPVIRQGLASATPKTEAETEAPETETETGNDLSSRTEAAIKVLWPRLTEAMKRLPSLKRDVVPLVSAAQDAGRAGDQAKADAALRDLQALLQKVEAQKVDAGQGAASVSVMKLGKARLDWKTVSTTAQVDLGVLKGRIRRAFAGRPDLSQEVEAGLKRLDHAISQINDDLGRELDRVLNEADATRRAGLARDVADMARAFLARTTTDKVIKAIDGTKFMPGLSVVKPLTVALNDILAALDQSSSETAA